MGFDDIKGKAGDALGSDKGEEMSDKGLDKAGEFAEGKGVGGEHVDKGRDFADDKVGNDGEGEQQG